MQKRWSLAVIISCPKKRIENYICIDVYLECDHTLLRSSSFFLDVLSVAQECFFVLSRSQGLGKKEEDRSRRMLNSLCRFS